MLGRRVLARPAAARGKPQLARVISLLPGGVAHLLYDKKDGKQNVQTRDVDAATLKALVAASPLEKVGGSIARCTVKGSDDLTNNLKVGEVRMGPLVLEFGTLVRQPVVIVGIYATPEEFSVWLKWLTPLSHPDVCSLHPGVVQGRDRLHVLCQDEPQLWPPNTIRPLINVFSTLALAQGDGIVLYIWADISYRESESYAIKAHGRFPLTQTGAPDILARIANVAFAPAADLVEAGISTGPGSAILDFGVQTVPADQLLCNRPVPEMIAPPWLVTLLNEELLDFMEDKHKTRMRGKRAQSHLSSPIHSMLLQSKITSSLIHGGEPA